jgi:hypothetical protein
MNTGSALFIMPLIIGGILVVFGGYVLLWAPERPGGTIKVLGMVVDSKGAGLPLVALGAVLVAAPLWLAPRFETNAVGTSPTTTTTARPSTSKLVPPVLTSPLASQSQTASGNVFYAGPAGIPGTGMDFDHNPPMPGSGNVSATAIGLESSSSAGVTVSQYLGTSQQPSESDCRAWALSHGSPDLTANLAKGDQLCLITQRGRVVLFVITATPDSWNGLTGQATVWNAP